MIEKIQRIKAEIEALKVSKSEDLHNILFLVSNI